MYVTPVSDQQFLPNKFSYTSLQTKRQFPTATQFTHHLLTLCLFCAEDNHNQWHIFLGFAQRAKRVKRCALCLSPVECALEFSFSASSYPKEAENKKWNHPLGRRSIYLICSLSNRMLLLPGRSGWHHQAVLPFSETWTCCSWMKRNWMKFNKGKLGPCPWGGITSCTIIGQGGKQLCRAGPGNLGGEVAYEPAMCPHGQGGQWSPGIH